jgi:hypothetical protein
VRASLWAWTFAAVAAAGSARAQGNPKLAIDLPPSPDPPSTPTSPPPSAAPASPFAGPAIRAVDVLNDGQTRDLLRNGFPARLHFKMEIWHSGFPFSTLEGTDEWNVIVRFDPLQKRYRAARLHEDSVSVIGDFEQYPALATALAAPYVVPLVPKRRGSVYLYSATLDVEMLSLSDLDEVERWLRGEMGPAVRGEKDAGGAIGRGLRLFFVRLVGAERRHYQATSHQFKMR